MEIYGFNILIFNNQVTCEKAFKASSGTYIEIEVSINNNLITKKKIINCKCCYIANILHIQNKISIFSINNFCKNNNKCIQKSYNNTGKIKKKLNKFKPNNLELLNRVNILKYYFMLVYFKTKYKNIMFYCTLEYNKQLLNF